MTYDRRLSAQKKNCRSAAETLISASNQAQEGLIAAAGEAVIPAVAESPIPVLAAKNRTPDRLMRRATKVAGSSRAA
ncbi:hypothetical protein [Paracoccus laeviglucosivorans]|nr:hypothetical protein [Paracoccus laeviglucosivorans]